MEIDEQIAVVAWCDAQKIPIWHNVNEGKRSYTMGKKLVRAGLRRGVPDLQIPVPSGQYHGLFIEMKYGRNKTTPEQEYWLGLLSKQGYAVKVAYSAEIAIKAISRYLSLGGKKWQAR